MTAREEYSAMVARVEAAYAAASVPAVSRPVILAYRREVDRVWQALQQGRALRAELTDAIADEERAWMAELVCTRPKVIADLAAREELEAVRARAELGLATVEEVARAEAAVMPKWAPWR